MKAVHKYIAKDGTEFKTLGDCFDYERAKYYPGIKLFGYYGGSTESWSTASYIRTHNLEEYNFVNDYTVEDLNWTLDEKENNEECNGDIMFRTDGGIDFYEASDAEGYWCYFDMNSDVWKDLNS